MTNTSMLDRFLLSVAPTFAVRRQHARMRHAELTRARMYYEAATTSHRGSNWRPIGTDATGEIRMAGERMRNLSRDLVRNNAYASKALNVIVNNVIGQGVLPSIASSNKRARDTLEGLARDHFDTPACDYTGQMDLYGIQALALRTVVESGEVLIRRRRSRSSDNLPLPFQLQALEPDYIYNLREGDLPNGNVAIQGIEFDRSGRRVAYHLYRNHPGSQTAFTTSEIERVDASEIVHVYRVDRPGQVRGVTWFAPVMLRLRDLNDYSDATLVRQKIASCFTAFVTSNEPDMRTFTTEGENGALSINEQPLQYFEPGKIERLLPGESVEFPTPPQTTDFNSYAAATLREIAAGLGISYEAMSGDLSHVNFSSGRMGWLEFQRNIEAWRMQMLQPQMLAPVGGWFLEAAKIKSGVAGSPKVNWTPPRREMISLQEEVPASVKMIRAGLMSRSEVLRKMGYDPDVVDAEIRADQDRIDALGIVLDSDPRQRTDYGQEVQDHSKQPNPTNKATFSRGNINVQAFN